MTRMAAIFADLPHHITQLKAKLVDSPEKWPWSSTRAHLAQADDGIVTVAPMLSRIDDWKNYVSENNKEERDELIRLHGRTGRPLGSDCFIDRLQQLCKQPLRPRKPGSKTDSQ